MEHDDGRYAVLLETTAKRAVATALAWPGWCRVGRDEPAALQALVDSGPRYRRVMERAGHAFRPPAAIGELEVVERLTGNAATDFGVPGAIPALDREALDEAGIVRGQQVLTACWQTFDAAVSAAADRELRRGPRGGGRDLAEIVRHVVECDQAYLKRLASRFRPQDVIDPQQLHATIRAAILTAVAAAARGELPSQGPRGGAVWPPRFFVRYVAWHILDHAWEIEDRAI